MALVLGTNSGFVSVAPTADPVANTSGSVDGEAMVIKDTSPTGVNRITEVGWWVDDNTTPSDVNFEVGLYAADGAVVPGEAGTLLYVSRTNATGTTLGWKVVTVDWEISSSTNYWIGVQVDSTAGVITSNKETSGGSGFDERVSMATLPDPFGGGALEDADGMYAIYAVCKTNYTLAADQGSVALTGQMAGLLRAFVMSMGTGVYTLTGNALDFLSTGWRYVAKVVASFGNDTKHTSTFTSETKHTANYGSETKNTAIYTSPTKNTGNDNYIEKSE